SWLGLWISISPLFRVIGLGVFALLMLAALYPLIFVRFPTVAEGLHRLDRGSGLAHRPATAIADELAVTSSDPVSLALWRAHVERAVQAARGLKAGWPKPHVVLRDPYALRGLVAVLAIATFFAAGGERSRRIAAAFDWQGAISNQNYRVDAWVTPPTYTGRPPVILPGLHPSSGGERSRRIAAAFDWQGAISNQNYRVDAWVTPPTYTGRPPVILPGLHPGEASRIAAASFTVPTGSVLVIRSTGAPGMSVAVKGGL